MSEENINIATKEYADAHFGNTSETDDNLVIATKEYVDSIPTGMVMDGTALKGQLCNPQLATIVGDGADGSTLTDGSYMFYYCANLTSWTAELPNLTNGSFMFSWCTNLTSFDATLPKLEDGNSMFYYCRKLTSWTVDLPYLTNSIDMFYGCSGLTTWTADLPNLENANYMFSSCDKLTSFNAGTEGLKSLTSGSNMFKNCILDEASVLHILNTIPTYTSGTHQLHLGKYANYQTSDKVAAKLRTSTGGTVSTPIPAATNYRCVDDDGNDKGWTITVQA